MSYEEIRGKSLGELEAMLREKLGEVYQIRREIDRRKGNVPKAVDVDFEKYVTK